MDAHNSRSVVEYEWHPQECLEEIEPLVWDAEEFKDHKDHIIGEGGIKSFEVGPNNGVLPIQGGTEVTIRRRYVKWLIFYSNGGSLFYAVAWPGRVGARVIATWTSRLNIVCELKK
ncbi:hypothetical protein BD779DRAFT_1677094 [Infundibulicybe gibba]|nr:hypothetical protein BD779DRAFT_1677094 [Infundibulicybe gibba]